MLNENTTVTRIGCFGMFSCYDAQNEACMNCELSRECSQLASERYEKIKDVLQLEND